MAHVFLPVYINRLKLGSIAIHQFMDFLRDHGYSTKLQQDFTQVAKGIFAREKAVEGFKTNQVQYDPEKLKLPTKRSLRFRQVAVQIVEYMRSGPHPIEAIQDFEKIIRMITGIEKIVSPPDENRIVGTGNIVLPKLSSSGR